MKIAVSIPDPVFEAAEQLAHRLGMSRSELYVAAIKQYVSVHRPETIAEQLNAVYADTGSGLDPMLMELQRRTLERVTDIPRPN